MAVTNALMKIGENALTKAGEKAVEKAATNALTKAGTGALTKLTMDAVLPKASRSALTSLLSPNSGFTSVFGRIADKNGTPLSLYHSTPYEFSRFDDSKLGTNTMYDNTAYGHFATPDKDFSSRFLDIDNTGQKGRTMELQAKIKNPITHPYGASAKYSGDELDNIVENYMLATGNGEGLDMLRDGAMEDGMSLYDEYMNATMDESPFELAKYERKDLMDKGYDGMEIVEGLKNDLVDGSKSKAPISSIVAFEGKNLSPVSHIPVQNMSSGAMDIPVERDVADRVSKYMSKPIDVKDMSSGSLPVAVDTDNGVANLGQLAERKSIPIQHGDNRPDITTGAELRLADNPFGTHEGVLFSSDKGFTPVGSDGSSDYRNMFYGNTNNQKVLDITDPYNAQALERTLGVRGFTNRNGTDMLGDIRSGVTETMGDKGGVLGELLKKNDIGYIKGKSGLNDTEYVAANTDAILKSYGGDTLARSMEYLDNPGSTLNNLRVGKDVTGDGVVDAVATKDVNADGILDWNDPKSVHNWAKKDQVTLDKMGRSIAEKHNFPEYTDFSPKSIESMVNKVKRKGGDYSLASMKDHTRNKIMMNTWQDVPAVLSDMEEMGLSPSVEFVVNDWGYKGLHITGRFGDGLGWEIQLTTPEDWPRKLRSDAIYDKWRDVELDTASPQEVMGYLNAMRESKAMWSESNIPDLSKYDNTGVMSSKVELSPEQNNYFKDSVIRDGDGNLMPVYHTTKSNNGRTTFDYRNGLVWVTPDKNYSSGFSEYGYNPAQTHELYANIKNPVYVGHIDPAINDSTIEKLSMYSGLDDETLLAIADKEDAKNIWQITNSKRFKELMEARGYDGIEAREGGNVVSYAAFSPDQVKSVKNIKPTSDLDINKYSGYGGFSQYSPDAKRVGSKDVAKLDRSTLPVGYDKMESLFGKAGDDATKMAIYEELGVEKGKNITKDMLKEFLDSVGYDSDVKTKAELWQQAKRYMQDTTLDEMWEEGASSTADVVTSRLGNKPWSKGKSLEQLYTGASGRTGRLDAEYSDRLGIGRSNTPMLDTLNGDSAAGDYWNGAIGTDPTWAEGEFGVSTVAHERLHAMQHAGRYNWDERVGKAINDLRNDLKPFYHDEKTLRAAHKSGDIEYWKRDIEQEARMLQSYLENEGYTKKGTTPEWGDEVKPAFDKFFEKLRELSKKGVALPAITALFGGGAMMAGGQKKEEG